MCRLASFLFNPINMDVVVHDLCSHSNTEAHLKLNKNLYFEGHYLPTGEIECRLPNDSKFNGKECEESIRSKFPTFIDFIKWANLQDIVPVTELTIEDSNIKSIPLFPKLTFLHIYNCPNIKTIPVFPKLIRLWIDNCLNIKSIPLFPKLTLLHIYNCPNIKTIPVFPKLTELRIYNCPNIKIIPDMPKLKLKNKYIK